MASRVRVVVEADIRPTEDEEKVIQAIRNFFDPDTVSIEGDPGYTRRIIAVSYTLASLERLRHILRVQRILDAARKAMKRGKSSDRLVFMLHKQAMSVGRASFVGGENESPLGAITVVIEHPEPDRVIDWLAPPTVRGRPVFELDRPPE